MDTRSGYAVVNGGRLYYELTGLGQPLVLVHGYTLDRRMWDEQLAALAAHYQVLRYDLRGFGRSSVPDGPYRHADDLKALLDELGLGPAAVMGFSLGGWVAVNFALAYPPATRALVLVDAVVLGIGWSQAYLDRIDPVWKDARVTDVKVTAARWLALPYFEPALANPRSAEPLRRIVDDYSGWSFVHDDPEQTGTQAKHRLHEIAVPALVVVGELDIPDLQLMAGRLLGIPQSRLLRLPGAGHMAPMEAPEAFNAGVLKWLGENLGASR